jgi:hypothetical protein
MPQLLALSLCLVPLMAQAAYAQSTAAAREATAAAAIPIEQEPRHRLVFENGHVRLFDVELEPGYRSLYHWHRADGVFVNIAAAPTIAQDVGKQPVRRAERAIGETYFIDYGANPKAHRVANAGNTPYRVVDAEILAGCGAADHAAQDAHLSVLIDNARVRVARIVLSPGKSTQLPAPCGMLIAVSAAKLRLETPAGTHLLDMPAGGFDWRQQARSVSLVNAGTSEFHGVDIRLK